MSSSSSSNSSNKKRKRGSYKTPDTPDRDKSTRSVYRHAALLRSRKFQKRLADARHPTRLWEKQFQASRLVYEKAVHRKFQRSFINKFGSISVSDGYMINFIIKKLIESYSRVDINKLKEVEDYIKSEGQGGTKVNFILKVLGPIIEMHFKRAKKMPKLRKKMAEMAEGEDNEVEYLKMRAEREALKLYETDDGLRKMTGTMTSPVEMAGEGSGQSIGSDKFDEEMLNRRGGRKKKYTKRKRRRRGTKKKRKKRNSKKRTRRRRRKRRR